MKDKDIEIEYRDIKTLIPYINNSRTHSDDQVMQVAASIKEFGFTNPVLVDGDNGIIAGHCRVMAAEKLQLKKVPTIELSHLSEAQKKAYIIADNKLALNAGWDDEVLANELLTLQDFDFDLGLTGFSSDELNDLLPDIERDLNGLTDDDEVPAVSAQAITCEGDLWILGNHRLLCGDATDTQVIRRLIGDKKIDLVFSDPPYGISVVNKNYKLGVNGERISGTVGDSGNLNFISTRNKSSIAVKNYALIKNDDSTETARAFYSACITMDFKNIILWGGNYFTDFLPPSRCWVIWNKETTGDFSQAEMAWTSFSKGGVSIFKHLWNGLSREGNRKDELSTRVHPTQKPVGLFFEIFRRFDGFKTVLDGFGGSGSTLIACEKAGNDCYIIEIEPQYCDVIAKRWQEYTGGDAILASNGRAFNAIMNEGKITGLANAEG